MNDIVDVPATVNANTDGQKLSHMFEFPELTSQLITTSTRKILTPLVYGPKLHEYICKMLSDRPIENCVVVAIDYDNQAIAYSVMSRGAINRTPYWAPEVLRFAVLTNAYGIVMYHNHPGGAPYPSRADDNIAHMLYDSLYSIGLLLYDFVVVGTGKNNYYAYAIDDRSPFCLHKGNESRKHGQKQLIVTAPPVQLEPDKKTQAAAEPIESQAAAEPDGTTKEATNDTKHKHKRKKKKRKK